jgi:carbonic anhydrase
MRTHNQDTQATVTPSIALQYLKEGNQRFVNNLKFNRNLLQQVNETRNGQWPFAVILSCIDSRTSAELIFDQGLGDIFSVRIAGNIANEDILGSMEFACKVAGSKLIMVLGHSKCGAIKGACDNVQMGNLTTLLSKLQPSVNNETATKENRTASNAAFVENVAAINVKQTVSLIRQKSTILNEMIEKGEVGICGAMYDVESGAVDFYSDTVIINQ